MADDVNKSKKGLPNTLADIGSGFEAIEHIGRRAASRSAEDRDERQKLQTASEIIEGLEDMQASRPNSVLPPYLANDLRRARESRLRLSPRIRLRNEARLDRAEEETRNAISRHFSGRSINGQISELSGNTDIMNRAMGMMNMSSRELEVARADIMSQIGGLESSSTRMVDEGLYDREGNQNPAMMAELKANYRKRDLMVRKLSTITAAERQKQALGEDPKSRTQDLFAMGQKAERTLFESGVSQELRSGTGAGAMSLDQLKQKEVQLSNELLQALDKLKNSANASADEVEKLRNQAENTAEELKKTQEAVRQGGGQAGGGGGFVNWMAKYGAAVGGAIAGAGALYSSVTVDQTNRVTANRSAAAGIANSLYNRRTAALSGDMTQLTMMSSDFLERSQYEGSVNARNSRIGLGAGLLGGGLILAGGLATLTGVGAAAGVGAIGMGSALLAGGAAAGTAAVGAKMMVNNGTDLARDVTGTAENLAEQQRQIHLQEQMAKITGAQRQRLYNYSMGSRAAMLAGGGKRGRDFFEQWSGIGADPMLARMEAAGIGTDQFASLSAQAFAGQGDRFNTNQIFAARNLERGGFGDMATNMNRMTALAGAGSNNPQAGLQSVLEAAFTKSLDSSKAIDSMVQNTAAMVQTSFGAQIGFDTTAASSAILSNLVNPNTENKEFAVNRAAGAAEKMNAINTGIGVNFADMAGTASIARASGVGSAAAMNLKKLDNATIASINAEMERMNKLDPKERAVAEKAFASRLSDQFGLTQYIHPLTGEVNKPALMAGINERNKSIFREGTFIGNIDQSTPGYNELIAGKITAEDVKNNPKYKALRGRIGESAALQGLTLDEALTRGEAGSTALGKGLATDAISGKTPTSKSMQDADQLAVAQFREMTKEAGIAAKQLGGVAEALNKINQATQGLAGKLNDKTADEFRSAAATAAKDFVVGADTFKVSVNEFGSIVRDFARGANIKLPTDSNTSKK